MLTITMPTVTLLTCCLVLWMDLRSPWPPIKVTVPPQLKSSNILQLWVTLIYPVWVMKNTKHTNKWLYFSLSLLCVCVIMYSVYERKGFSFLMK